jgi:hypothetical protein
MTTFNYSYTLTYDDVTYSVQEVKVYENAEPASDIENSYNVTYSVYNSNGALVGTIADALNYTSNGYTKATTVENNTTGAVINATFTDVNSFYTINIDTDKSNYVVPRGPSTYNPSDFSYSYICTVIETNSAATYTITVTEIQEGSDYTTTYTITDSAGDLVRTVTDIPSLGATGNYTIRTFEGTDYNNLTNNTLTISENVD